MIPIFLSRPNPYTDMQQKFLSKLVQKLNDDKIKTITLVAKDYNPYESLTCLEEMIKRCYGIIIISFGQTFIENGIIKKGAVNSIDYFDSYERTINNTWITSPFCHIEGAIAFSHKLPMLTIEQKHVKIEGIIKDGEHALKGPEFELDTNDNIDNYFSSNQFIDIYNKWYAKVIEFSNFINYKEINLNSTTSKIY